jgi:ribosome maturation factor RimP
MALPNVPVTLSVEQIRELNQKLSSMRHDVNGKLTQITLALELLRIQPEGGERWLNMMAEQPQKIVADLAQFSRDLEVALRITRP